jgi:hypothetical protein
VWYAATARLRSVNTESGFCRLRKVTLLQAVAGGEGPSTNGSAEAGVPVLAKKQAVAMDF